MLRQRFLTAIVALLAVFCLAALCACASNGEDAVGDSSESAGESATLPMEDTYGDVAQTEADIRTWNAFASRLSSAVISQESDRNDCFSPASLYFAMSLLVPGVQGDAQQQLLDILGAKDADDLYRFCHTWINALEMNSPDSEAQDEGDGAALELANSVWIDDDYQLSESYIEAIRNYMQSEAFSAAFGTQQADVAMQKWVSDNTNDLLNPNFMTSADTIATLLNTLYFKDAWAEPFTDGSPYGTTFHASTGDVDAQYMQGSFSGAGYVDADRFTASQIPFRQGFTMTIFLPNEGISARELFADQGMVESMLDAQSEAYEVSLFMPKFQFDSRYSSLRETLIAIGVTDPFEPSASDAFEPMLHDSSNESFYVSDVVQETHLGVDENGAEAAAYTMMGIKTTALAPSNERVEMIVDRPFAYAIRSLDGVVLFAGVVENPTGSN